MGVKHAHQTTFADDPSSEVSASEWNADHAIDNRSIVPVALVNGLVPVAVQTGAYAAAAGDLVPVDTTSASVTVTLPAAPADGTLVAVKHVIRGGSHTVTITRGGSDVFNKAGGSTSLTLTDVLSAIVLLYQASTSIWYVLSVDQALVAGTDYYAIGGVAHAATTGITANDHHNQSHTNADHSAAGTPSTQAFGDAAAAGSSTSDAKSDHKHAMPANPVRAQSSTTPSDIGTPAVGSGSTDAKSDHVHGFPAWQAFTPGVSFGGGSTGVTYTNQQGRYLQVNNMVFFRLRLTLSAKGSSTGTALITGLPVAHSSNTPISSFAVGSFGAFSTITAPVTARAGGVSATTISLLHNGATALTDANFTNTSDIFITGSYEI